MAIKWNNKVRPNLQRISEFEKFKESFIEENGYIPNDKFLMSEFEEYKKTPTQMLRDAKKAGEIVRALQLTGGKAPIQVVKGKVIYSPSDVIPERSATHYSVKK